MCASIYQTRGKISWIEYLLPLLISHQQEKILFRNSCVHCTFRFVFIFIAVFKTESCCVAHNGMVCAADDLKSVAVSCLRLSIAGIRCVLLETEAIFFLHKIQC